jgi:hypothetical protein
MSRYGSDACTECGETSELLLAPRFPHICSRCLFRPLKPEDPRADLTGPAPWTPADTLAERLHAHKSNGTWRAQLDSRAARGKNLPESYGNRSRSHDGS